MVKVEPEMVAKARCSNIRRSREPARGDSRKEYKHLSAHCSISKLQMLSLNPYSSLSDVKFSKAKVEIRLDR
jgi:hypothetical protein